MASVLFSLYGQRLTLWIMIECLVKKLDVEHVNLERPFKAKNFLLQSKSDHHRSTTIENLCSLAV